MILNPDKISASFKLGVNKKAAGKTPERKTGDFGSFDDQIDRYTIITGTPKTVIPKVKHVLEYLRPGSIFFWDGDGAMDHDDSMRSLRLMGEEVLPAVREMSKELDLKSSFEVDTKTNQIIADEKSTDNNGLIRAKEA